MYIILIVENRASHTALKIYIPEGILVFLCNIFSHTDYHEGRLNSAEQASTIVIVPFGSPLRTKMDVGPVLVCFVSIAPEFNSKRNRMHVEYYRLSLRRYRDPMGVTDKNCSWQKNFCFWQLLTAYPQFI